MATLIDLHCHLDLYPDPQAVVREVVSRGVYVLSVTTTPSAFCGTAQLAPPNSKIRTSLGLHPELAAERQGELPLFERLLDRTDYVGEIGLDGSREHRASLDRQCGVLLDILLMCARAGGRTLSLHSREARARLLDLLALEPLAGQPILHWFTGTRREVDRANELGCWFSVGPAMLRSERGRLALAGIPRERLLPETDGPFGLIDGTHAYPWEAMDIVQPLSRLWRESEADVRGVLVENFSRLVRGGAGAPAVSLSQTVLSEKSRIVLPPGGHTPEEEWLVKSI
jgi:TatD DNase family protein